jgi:hypothetical protein
MKALTVLGKSLLAEAKSKEEAPPRQDYYLTTDGGPPDNYYKAVHNYILPGLTKALYADDKSERDAALSALKEIGTPEAMAAIEQALASPRVDTVQFTGYHPREAYANTQSGVYVYAHLTALLSEIENDIQQFKTHLGAEISKPRTAKQVAQILIGAPITVIPESSDVEFDPISLTKKWDGNWIRFNFDFNPKSGLIGESVFVRIAIQIHGIEVAHIKCPIEIIPHPLTPAERLANPLAAAKLRGVRTAQMYKNIFVSYSRSDKDVVQAYHFVQTAIGNEVFMDTYSIRTGDDWQIALARAIDKADIFQLFWSYNSAQSKNVRDEWDYALNHRSPEDRGVSFIRPVYWENPAYPPPSELSHLNFRFLSMQKEKFDTDESK